MKNPQINLLSTARAKYHSQLNTVLQKGLDVRRRGVMHGEIGDTLITRDLT